MKCLRHYCWGILFLAVLSIISAGCSGSNDDISRARWYLENGYPFEAEALYNRAISSGVETCEVYYGRALAKMVSFLSTTMNAGNAFDLTTLLPIDNFQQDLFPLAYTNYGNMDTLVETYLIPLLDYDIIPLIQYSTDVINRNCEFRTEKGIEITLSVVPEEKVWIGKQFMTSDAYLLRGIMYAVKGAMSYIASHNLNMGYVEGISYFKTITNITNMLSSDIVGFLRGAAVVFESSPEFLEWKQERKHYFQDVAPSFAQAMTDIARWMESVFISPPEGDDPTDNFIGYVDVNNDGKIDTGDELWLGIVNSWSEDGTVEFLGRAIDSYPFKISSSDLIGFVLFAPGDEYFSSIVQFLRKLSGIFSSGNSNPVRLSEFNALVPFGIGIFPDTIAIDFSKLFPESTSMAKPLREFLPVWGYYDPPGTGTSPSSSTHAIFLVEGEVPSSAGPGELRQEVPTNDVSTFCYTCYPGEHFPGYLYGASSQYFQISQEVVSSSGITSVVTVPDDCVEPSSAGVTTVIPVLYAYFQDPTFNGSLWVDLGSISGGNACAQRDAKYSGSLTVPDNYSLSKALADFQVKLGGLLNQ